MWNIGRDAEEDGVEEVEEIRSWQTHGDSFKFRDFHFRST